MKFLHTSDLHLGMRLCEYSLIDDQKYILDRIADIAVSESVDGVIVAGDIYDKSVPSAEAVSLFDGFLSRLYREGIDVYAIYGNHDSAERIAFGNELVKSSGIYLSGVFNGSISPIEKEDRFGKINIYLLPFVKPSTVRRFFEDKDINDHNDAVRACIDTVSLDKESRNIIVAHQFVTGASRCASEEITVGDADNVGHDCFEDFDYTALGHIHSPQTCHSEYVNYSGTPLKYSLSEANDKKSVTIVELLEKGKVITKRVPLAPLRDMLMIKGSYDEIMRLDYYRGTPLTESYLGICLTDEMEVPDAMAKLRTVYKYPVKLRYENSRSLLELGELQAIDQVEKAPDELFAEFYKLRTGNEMTSEQSDLINEIVSEIWEAENETN